jgi:carboxymethylenebutenolidase
MDMHCFVPGGASHARLPAVIVLQEAFGVNAHVKRVCRRVAGAGYAAFAPELFHRTGRGLEFGYDEFPRIKPILGQLTNDRIYEDLEAAHRHASLHSGVDPDRIAAWGFCMGGWASVLAASGLPIAAAISFYGGGLVRPRAGIGFTPLLDRLGTIGCPLLLVFGAKDGGIPPEDVEAVRSRLQGLGKVHEIEVYPEAGHGFFCEDRPAYHEASALAAWARATAWLAAALA